jgi:preprotein translocase subunit SecG
MPRPVTFVTAAAMRVVAVVIRILLQALGPVATQIAIRKSERTYRSGSLPNVLVRATKTLSLLYLTLSCVSIAIPSMQQVLKLKS